MTTSQPNILILMADQLAAPALPIHDADSPVKAPNIQALAQRGVVFDSAYCNSPLCAPSRFVFMTGRLPSKIGAYDNAAELRSDVPTFAHYLREIGYQTALSGKMHFCGPDQLHGFEQRFTTDIYPADYGWAVNWDGAASRPTWYHDMSSVTQAGPCVRSNQLDFDDEVVFHAKRYLYDRARDDAGDRPFCLTVSMTHPHDPYAIPEEYWNRYSEAEINLPSLNNADVPADPHSDRLRALYQTDTTEISDQQIRNARRAYYGAISYVDDQIGLLLNTLEETGLADNTIVVFCGDHGDMLGERGLWYKMSFFEWSSRVPLIVSAPQRFSPRRVKESVSTLDLLPTLVELAGGGIDYATDLEGRSLVPHLSGRGGHDEVIGEYMGEGAITPVLMIRRGDYKYIHCPADPDQLYNLAEDPEERYNLVDDPAEAERLTALRREVAANWDLDAVHREVLDSQRRRRLVASALSKGRVTSWDHQPHFDASVQYMRNTLDLGDLESRARLPRVAD